MSTCHVSRSWGISFIAITSPMLGPQHASTKILTFFFSLSEIWKFSYSTKSFHYNFKLFLFSKLFCFCLIYQSSQKRCGSPSKRPSASRAVGAPGIDGRAFRSKTQDICVENFFFADVLYRCLIYCFCVFCFRSVCSVWGICEGAGYFDGYGIIRDIMQQLGYSDGMRQGVSPPGRFVNIVVTCCPIIKPPWNVTFSLSPSR